MNLQVICIKKLILKADIKVFGDKKRIKHFMNSFVQILP